MNLFTCVQLVGRRYAKRLFVDTGRCFSATATMSSAESTSQLPDITATPAADQHIFHDGREYKTIKEGLAYILVPATAPTVPQTTPKGENKPQDVFYNPIQQFNRDLSVLAIKAFGAQWFQEKNANQENIKRKLAAKKDGKRSKKRKWAADGGVEEASRKAGKLDSAATDDTTAETTISESTHNRLSDADNLLQQELLNQEKENSLEEDVNIPTHRDLLATDAAEPSNPATDGDDSLLEASETLKDKPGSATLKAKPFTILDALSATGLRALRYCHEIPFTTSVTANDLLSEATKSINLNVKHNKLSHKIIATTSNAMSHMYSLLDDSTRDARNHPQWSRKYNVIDLDPYGTAAPFLDAAVQAVRDDGGLLCVTCTDAGVWASNGYPEKCYALYGGTPIKGQQSHEGGLRLILNAIATSAARYGLAMQPLLSLSIDFYARVFVRIHRSPAEVKFLAGKTMMVYNCDSGCGAWATQMVARNKVAKSKKGTEIWKHTFAQGPTNSEKCEHCGYRTHIAGPMYAGSLHDPTFIKRILDDLPNIDKEIYKTTARIEGMLTVALEECLPPVPIPTSASEINPDTELSSESAESKHAALDPTPFLFLPSTLSKVIHCVTPIENAFRGALRGLGYRVTRSHTKPGSIKTDAPWAVIWEIMREWVRQKSPVREGAVREGTAGWKILGLGDKKDADKANSSEVVEKMATLKGRSSGEEIKKDDTDIRGKLNVVFDEELGKEKDAKKLVRYQLNPRENWGPMARAKGKP